MLLRRLYAILQAHNNPFRTTTPPSNKLEIWGSCGMILGRLWGGVFEVLIGI